MKNLVTEGYTAWLKKFRESNAADKRCVQISTKLIADLKTIDSIDKLNILMADYLTKPNEDSIHQYIPPSFYSTLSQWQDSLLQLVGECDTALSVLKDLSITTQNAPLIRFLTEILSDEKARLNIRIPSILSCMRNEKFPELIQYITTLPYEPYPTNPREGDFAAIRPVNDDHKICLFQLNNLAKSSDLHPGWNSGNGLLQSSLLIYLDMYMEEISLDDDDDFIPPPENGCTLL